MKPVLWINKELLEYGQGDTFWDTEVSWDPNDLEDPIPLYATPQKYCPNTLTLRTVSSSGRASGDGVPLGNVNIGVDHRLGLR